MEINKKQLEDKIALITGGAQGQGMAEAKLFVERGAKVVIGDVNEKKGKELAEELGPSASFFKLDVSLQKDWEEIMLKINSKYSSLDILVSNAGISPAPKRIEDLDVEEYLKVININQIGSFLAIKSVIPLMRKSGGGSIITISSTAGVTGVTGLAPYSSSKFAIRALTKVAALELGHYGIRINAILPGPIDTEMLKPEGGWGVDMRDALSKSNPLGRIGKPSDVAELAAFLASDASSFCNGGDFIIDGGVLAGTYSPPDGKDPWES